MTKVVNLIDPRLPEPGVVTPPLVASASFFDSVGNWAITNGSGTLTATRVKQLFTELGSMLIQRSTADDLTVALSGIEVPVAESGWTIRGSAWVWADDDTYVKASVTTNRAGFDPEVTSAVTFVRAAKWTLVSVIESSVSIQDGLSTATVDFSLQFADQNQTTVAATSLSATEIYVTSPVVSAPNAAFTGSMTSEIYLRLPEFLRNADAEQTDPTYPLFRFLDVVFMEMQDIYELWESLRYEQISVTETHSSELVDPELMRYEWMAWLATILGINLQVPATGYTSWLALETGLDTDTSGDAEWDEWEVTSAGTWGAVEGYDTNSVDIESELRWQLSTAIYGVKGGTDAALVEGAKHVLTGTKTVTLNKRVGGDPWHIEIVTLLAETPGVSIVGDESQTVLDAVAAATPAGFQVSHRVE